MANISFKENDISKQPALQLLQKMGYVYLSPEQVCQLRGSSSNVLLEPVLREQLQRLNVIRVNNLTESFSPQNIENGIVALRNISMANGYMSAAAAVYDLLTYGKTLEQSIDGDKKSYNLQYINWEDWSKNVFHVTDEFEVTRAGRSDTYRPDLVLFVNGIPLAVIECKRPDQKDSIEHAISQHLRNQKEDGIRQLYQYAALVLGINGTEAVYGTTATPMKFWSRWRSSGEDNNYENALRALKTDAATPTEQDRTLYSLCRPERLLRMMYRYTLFDNGIKKIARYQQFFAVEQVLQRVTHLEQGKRRGGVIWHTQGSGKSLTMVMIAQAIALEKNILNPKIILVTDRTDLDRQLTDTFRKCGVFVENASTGAQLVRLLQSPSVEVITTIINKFETAVKQIRKPLTSPDIFVLIDEAHRSQYGTMGANMERTLPNACRLAMTGTPLMKKEKNTAARFGGIIRPVYTVQQAVEDKAVVPLLYEGRVVPQEIHKEVIDNFFERICEPLTDEQRFDLKKKFSRASQLNMTQQRLYAIAWDISLHFRDNWQGTPFKGQLVCPKKAIAIRYKQFLDEIGIVSSEVLITPPDTREGEEDVYEENSDIVQQFWKQMLDRYGNQKNYETSIISSYRNSDKPEIIIVVDKLLTGFDEPKNTVMYLDRKLQEHTLLQAVARVNRVAEEKDYGYIIDYFGVLRYLDEALATYSDGVEDIEECNDIRQTMQQITEETNRLPQLHSELWDIFKTIPDKQKRDLETYCEVLRPENIRHEFYDKLSVYARCLKTALSTLEFYQTDKPEVIARYKDDLVFFVNLRHTVRLRYSDTVDYGRYEGQIQKLLDTHVESGEVKMVTPLVNIFDKEHFEYEVERVVGTKAKADTIASRTSKYINENMDLDPAFFRKFSELLQQTIDDYLQGRIDEKTYLERVRKMKDDVLTHTSSEIPPELQNNDAGKAFYGLLLEKMKAKDEQHSETEIRQIATHSAVEFCAIIQELTVIVDWQTNYNLIGRTKLRMEDYLIDNVQRVCSVPVSFDDMDEIIDGCIEIAKLWYK